MSDDSEGKMDERGMAIKDFHTELGQNQCSWDFLAFRASRSAADVEVLKGSSKTTIALTYLHNLTKN